MTKKKKKKKTHTSHVTAFASTIYIYFISNIQSLYFSRRYLVDVFAFVESVCIR